MAYMSLGIVVAIFGASTINYTEAQRKLSLLFAIILLLIAVPDYRGVAIEGANPPDPNMIVNPLVYIAFFMFGKRGVNTGFIDNYK